MLSAESGVSSKRVAGFLGWIVCLSITIWSTIYTIPTPDIVEMLFICSTSLLGIDSITGIWKKNINKNNNT
jgi:hypothetical protein